MKCEEINLEEMEASLTLGGAGGVQRLGGGLGASLLSY